MSTAHQKIPRISVVMPAYNAEKYIESTLETLLAQTYKDWEAFIVDGGSTDNTLGMLDQYAKIYPNLHIIREKCQSPYDAICKGILRTRGEFVYILCFSDGYLTNLWYEKCMEFMDADPQLSIVWGIPFDLYDDPQNPGKELTNPHYVYAHFLRDASTYKRRSVMGVVFKKLRNPISFLKKLNAMNVQAVRSFMKHEAPPQKQAWFGYWLKTGTVFPDGNMCVARTVLLDCLQMYEGGDDVGHWDDLFFDFNAKGYLSACIPIPANYGRLNDGRITEIFDSTINAGRLRYFGRIKEYRNDIEKGKTKVQFQDRKGFPIPTQSS